MPQIPPREAGEAGVISSTAPEVPSEPALTQEELDHIAYIQKLAEETALTFQPPPRPPPPSASVEELRRDSIAAKELDYREELRQESRDESEATSGADQLAASEAGSPVPLYERTSPLLEADHEEIVEPELPSMPQIPPREAGEAGVISSTAPEVPSEPALTQEELDHIAYIQKLAEETALTFQPPPRPPPPSASVEELRRDSIAAKELDYREELRQESRDESEATSGADQLAASEAGSPVPLYERTSPLLEADHEEIVEPELPSMPQIPPREAGEAGVISSTAPEVPSEPALTQEELDHIAYIQKLAEETALTFQPPPRPPPPSASVEELRRDSIAAKELDYREELRQESRDESEATSGADQLAASEAGSPVPLYERTSPLLEADHEEIVEPELPSMPQIPPREAVEAGVISSSVPEVPSEPALTQEELDHIAYIQKLAEETALTFQPPPRPPPPSASVEELRRDSIAAKELDYREELRQESRDESEATSGADQLAASEAGSPVPLYERTSPLLEADHEEIVEPELPSMPQIPPREAGEAGVISSTAPEVPSEPALTQEELDHIAYIQKLAEETALTFQPPPRPPPPSASVEELRRDSIAAKELDYREELRQESRDESEATSGADQLAASEAGSPVPLYERTSPLLEADHEEIVEPELPSMPQIPPREAGEAGFISSTAPEVPSEPALTQEELDHIAYIQKLAEETALTFQPPPRPPPPSASVEELRRDSIAAKELDYREELRQESRDESEATSGADQLAASEAGSPVPLYERTSPLLEADHEEIVEPELPSMPQIPPREAGEAGVISSTAPEVPSEPALTQEELDHIAYIQKLAEETALTFQPPPRPPPPSASVEELRRDSIAAKELDYREELRQESRDESEATSGADQLAASEAGSPVPLYERTSPLLEADHEEIVEPELPSMPQIPPREAVEAGVISSTAPEVPSEPALTQEELDHIAYIQKLAEETALTFQPPPRPPPPSASVEELRRDSIAAKELDYREELRQESRDESEATSGADQLAASEAGSPVPLYERTSPLLEADHEEIVEPELPSMPQIPPREAGEAGVISSTAPEVPSEPALTQEELDHIAYIQKLAEETALTFQPPPRPPPPSASVEELRRDSIAAKELDYREELRQESRDESEATSGADQLAASEAGSPVPLYERTSPLLEADHEEIVEPELPSMPQIPPREAVEAGVISSTAPEVPSEPALTQEELDHIAYIQKLAEETALTFQPPPRPPPPSASVEELRRDSIAAKELDYREELRQESRDESEATSGADQLAASEAGSPVPLYERTSPLLEADHEEIVEPELPSMPQIPPREAGEAGFISSTAPEVPSEPALTQEELDHIAYIQKLAEETALTFQPPPRPPPPSASVEELRRDSIAAKELDYREELRQESRDESEATSGADQLAASEAGSPVPLYERTSPLLEADHEEIVEPELPSMPQIPPREAGEAGFISSTAPEVPSEPALTQEELDHIAYIQKLAEETALTFQPPPRPPPPSASVEELRRDSIAAKELDYREELRQESRDESEATSGADQLAASEAGSPVPLYERTSPLLEADHEEIVEPELPSMPQIPPREAGEAGVISSTAPEVPSEPALTQEELDHIAYIQKLAEETALTFQPPPRPPPPSASVEELRRDSIAAKELDYREELRQESRDESEATSGADQLAASEAGSPVPLYERTSPLLEADHEEIVEPELPSMPQIPPREAGEAGVISSTAPEVPSEPALTQEELDHIAYIQKLAEETALTFQPPPRPPPPSASVEELRRDSIAAKELDYREELRQESRDESEATSGADQLAASEAGSPVPLYERTSPLLEADHEEIVEPELPSMPQIPPREAGEAGFISSTAPEVPSEPALTQEELDHIAYIQKLAEETALTFQPPPRPPPPSASVEELRRDSIAAKELDYREELRQESRDESEATSGADQLAASEAGSPVPLYERTSPLLEADHEEIVEPELPSMPQIPPREAVEAGVISSTAPEVPSEPALTQEELDHIAYIQKLAEETALTFQPPPRPPPPSASVEELRRDSIAAKELDYREELRQESRDESEATSGADQLAASEAGSPVPLYERTSPLLEADHEEIVEPELPSMPQIPPREAVEAGVISSSVPEVPSEPALTQEELDHIAYIQKLAEETALTFQPPPRPPPPSASVEELRRDSIAAKELDYREELRQESRDESEATSGADQLAASEAGSPVPLYERTSPLLEADHEEIVEPELPSMPQIPPREAGEAGVISSTAPEVPSEPALTQEELDHIAYIQKLAEETALTFQPPPRPPPPSASVEELRRDSIAAKELDYREELRQESRDESEATSGADQLAASEAGSPVPLYERTSPLLEADHEEIVEPELPSMPQIPPREAVEAGVISSSVPEVPSEPALTQEELDHIAYIQKLAEETALTFQPPPRPPPPSASVEELRRDSIAAKELDYREELRQESRDESEATSGADQLAASEAGSPVPLYERTSPLLEADHEEIVEPELPSMPQIPPREAG
ncbi:hypothetical protein COOONC_01582 [Cooperia oncophora]